MVGIQGKWEILSEDSNSPRYSRWSLWNAKCIKCGHVETLTTMEVRHQRGCRFCSLGIFQEFPQFVLYKRVINKFWACVKTTNKKRGMGLYISKEEALRVLVKQNNLCAISGMPIWFASSYEKDKRGTSASLDRIDSNKPYLLENVQWVDKRINWMKIDFSQDEFIELCIKIHKYQLEKFNV